MGIPMGVPKEVKMNFQDFAISWEEPPWGSCQTVETMGNRCKPSETPNVCTDDRSEEGHMPMETMGYLWEPWYSSRVTYGNFGNTQRTRDTMGTQV